MKKRFIQNLISSFAFFAAAFMVSIQVRHIIAEQDYHVVSVLAYWVVIAALFLFRKPSQDESTRLGHWVVAITACFVNFFIIPLPQTPAWLQAIGAPIQWVSMGFVFVTLHALGRSFGVIAARREVKTHGMYRFVRHPLYAFELLAGVGVILQNVSPTDLYASLLNGGIFLTVLACQILRMREEEAVLGRDDTYRDYMSRVPYRLIPGVY